MIDGMLFFLSKKKKKTQRQGGVLVRLLWLIQLLEDPIRWKVIQVHFGWAVVSSFVLVYKKKKKNPVSPDGYRSGYLECYCSLFFRGAVDDGWYDSGRSRCESFSLSLSLDDTRDRLQYFPSFVATWKNMVMTRQVWVLGTVLRRRSWRWKMVYHHLTRFRFWRVFLIILLYYFFVHVQCHVNVCAAWAIYLIQPLYKGKSEIVSQYDKLKGGDWLHFSPSIVKPEFFYFLFLLLYFVLSIFTHPPC